MADLGQSGQSGSGGGSGSAVGPGDGQGGGGGAAGGRGRGRSGGGRDGEIDELQRLLDRLLLVYTPTHPDVVALQNKIDELLGAGGLSAEEVDAVNRQVARCWKGGTGGAPVSLILALDRDGAVREAKPADEERAAREPAYAAQARAAAAALRSCGALALPPEKYRAWQRLVLRVGG